MHISSDAQTLTGLHTPTPVTPDTIRATRDPTARGTDARANERGGWNDRERGSTTNFEAKGNAPITDIAHARLLPGQRHPPPKDYQ